MKNRCQLFEPVDTHTWHTYRVHCAVANLGRTRGVHRMRDVASGFTYAEMLHTGTPATPAPIDAKPPDGSGM